MTSFSNKAAGLVFKVNVFHTLKEIHRSFDIMAQEFRVGLDTPLCVDGCGMCCRHNTPAAFRVEAMLVASDLGVAASLPHVKALGWLTERRPGVKTYGKHRGSHVGAITDHRAKLTLIKEGQRMQESPCPFLDEHSRCSIHDARPLGCRAYSVTMPPVGYCRREVKTGETPEARAYLSPNHSEFQKIRGLLGELSKMTAGKHSYMLDVGLLPVLVCQELSPEKLAYEIEHNHIPDAALGMGHGHSLFPWRLTP